MPDKTKTTVDYDGDGIQTSADDELASWDKNKDGKVSKQEKTAASKAGKIAPTSAKDYGVNQGFLSKYPELIDLVRKAIDEGWQNETFLSELDQTPWGQERTKTQEAFDLASTDTRKLADLNYQIENTYRAMKADAQASGITVDDQEIRNFARETVRSGLTDLDARTFFASKFKMPAAGESVTGKSAKVLADLQEVARSYGLGMDETNFQSKIQEALAAPDYNVWLESQKGVFRQQAKNLYPTIGDQLDEYTYADILDPYMNDAASVLGLNKATMDAMDPMWMTALSGGAGREGAGGAPMSRDEWLRTLRTDKKYGFDRTEKARKEYASLTDELFAAFGMA